MKIMEQSVEILTPLNQEEILKHLEQCARVCYKSEHKITDSSAPDFVKKLLQSGHEAAIEHVSITVKFITDRAIANQITRHRIASFCQESTRFCNYSQEQFDNEITVISPCSIHQPEHEFWKQACETAEYAYLMLLQGGYSPQQARGVLPLSLKTELVMTANLREWRYFLKLRTAQNVHPQMLELAFLLLAQFQEKLPVLFDDIVFCQSCQVF